MKRSLNDTLPAVLLTVTVALMALAGCSRGLKYDPSLYSPEIQFIDSLRYNTGGQFYIGNTIHFYCYNHIVHFIKMIIR